MNNLFLTLRNSKRTTFIIIADDNFVKTQPNPSPVQYIGESERTLQERFSEHKGYALNQKVNKTTGEHFSQKGHKVSDMRVTVLEKIFSSDPAIRKEREKLFINKMNTKYKGLNKIT